jgi:hypothetical protein
MNYELNACAFISICILSMCRDVYSAIRFFLIGHKSRSLAAAACWYVLSFL